MCPYCMWEEGHPTGCPGYETGPWEEPCCLLYQQHYDIDHEYDCPKAVKARQKKYDALLGVVTQNGVPIAECDSVDEAREAYPGIQIF